MDAMKPWRAGTGPYAAIITDDDNGAEMSETIKEQERESYGGNLVCESATPRFRPLLLAAPKLLEACEAALEQAEGCWQHHYGDNPEGGPTPRHIELLRAAIAKARGQA